MTKPSEKEMKPIRRRTWTLLAPAGLVIALACVGTLPAAQAAATCPLPGTSTVVCFTPTSATALVGVGVASNNYFGISIGLYTVSNPAGGTISIPCAHFDVNGIRPYECGPVLNLVFDNVVGQCIHCTGQVFVPAPTTGGPAVAYLVSGTLDAKAAGIGVDNLPLILVCPTPSC